MNRRQILPASFYERPTLDVADELIGKVLVHERRGRRTAGVIVEVEAYIGEDDPACHAASGLTRRNAPLYGPPGHAYVYFTYGMHYLVNAVTEREGYPAAVLIRALDPIEGLDLMCRRRGWPSSAVGDPRRRRQLCCGPGNLTVALGIGPAQNRLALDRAPLTIEDHGIRPPGISRSRRIGIRVGTERLWRFTWGGQGAEGRGQRSEVRGQR